MRSSRCTPSGDTAPACSANIHPFFLSSPASKPRTYALTRARGSERPNRDPIKPTTASNRDTHPARSTTR